MRDDDAAPPPETRSRGVSLVTYCTATPREGVKGGESDHSRPKRQNPHHRAHLPDEIQLQGGVGRAANTGPDRGHPHDGPVGSLRPARLELACRHARRVRRCILVRSVDVATAPPGCLYVPPFCSYGSPVPFGT
jgi:hypothetical protein